MIIEYRQDATFGVLVTYDHEARGNVIADAAIASPFLHREDWSTRRQLSRLVSIQAR